MFVGAVLAGFCLFSGPSCVPATYQSPQVLDQGETIVGVGISLPADLSLLMRRSLTPSTDIGVKFTGIPIPGFPFFSYNTLVDVKSIIRDRNSTLISGDLGIMVGHFSDTGGPTTIKSLGIYPLLLFGSERLYGGIGLDYFQIRTVKGPSFGDEAIVTANHHTTPRVVIGITMGGKWRQTIELHLLSKILNASPDEKGYLYGPMLSYGITRSFQK